MTSKSNPEIKPDFEAKPLLTTDQIFNKTTKKKRNLLRRLWKSEMKKSKSQK